MLKPIPILLLCMFAGTATASTHEAESALTDFEGKVLVLRHPLQDSFQQYDAAGKVLKGGNEGPWTVYGGVLIDKVDLPPKKAGGRGDERGGSFQFVLNWPAIPPSESDNSWMFHSGRLEPRVLAAAIPRHLQ